MACQSIDTACLCMVCRKASQRGACGAPDGSTGMMQLSNGLAWQQIKVHWVMVNKPARDQGTARCIQMVASQPGKASAGD